MEKISKLYIFLLLFNWIISFGNSNAQNLIFEVSPINKTLFDSVLKKSPPPNPLNNNKNRYQKSNGELTLFFNDGIKLTYKDVEGEEGAIEYEYVGFFEKINQHLVLVRYYENVEYIFVSKKGLETKLWDVPMFSYDQQYFFTFKSAGLEGDIIGIQVWKIVNDTENDTNVNLIKVLEINQLLFDIENCQWTKEGEIVFSAYEIIDPPYLDIKDEANFFMIKINK